MLYWFIEVQKEFVTFSKYIWQFVGNKPITNKFSSLNEIPNSTLLSQKISENLKKEGFNLLDQLLFMLL